MTKKTNQSGFSIIHLAVLLVVLGLIVWLWNAAKQQAAANVERKNYAAAEAQIKQFIDEASKLAPSKKETRKYCSRTSAKFEAGALGCSIDAEIKYLPLSTESVATLLKQLDKQQNGLRWVFKWDNTSSLQKLSESSYIKNRIYNFKNLSCSVLYKYLQNAEHKIVENEGKKILVVNSSCSGSALKEYY